MSSNAPIQYEMLPAAPLPASGSDGNGGFSSGLTRQNVGERLALRAEQVPASEEAKREIEMNGHWCTSKKRTPVPAIAFAVLLYLAMLGSVFIAANSLNESVISPAGVVAISISIAVITAVLATTLVVLRVLRPNFYVYREEDARTIKQYRLTAAKER